MDTKTRTQVQRQVVVAEFLTDEWIEEALTIYESVTEVAEEIRSISTILGLRVHEIPPDGVSEDFFIIVDEGIVIDLGRGKPPFEPDAVIEGDYETARGMILGEIEAASALATGRVKVTGDMGKLVKFAAQQQHPTSVEVTARVRDMTD